jgi:hypothetical protein
MFGKTNARFQDLEFLVDLLSLEIAELSKSIKELTEEVEYLTDFVGLDD